jgi:hypothetical protein
MIWNQSVIVYCITLHHVQAGSNRIFDRFVLTFCEFDSLTPTSSIGAVFAQGDTSWSYLIELNLSFRMMA